jgi:hypothetical protein
VKETTELGFPDGTDGIDCHGTVRQGIKRLMSCQLREYSTKEERKEEKELLEYK